jgi:hypothetical protein
MIKYNGAKGSYITEDSTTKCTVTFTSLFICYSINDKHKELEYMKILQEQTLTSKGIQIRKNRGIYKYLTHQKVHLE